MKEGDLVLIKDHTAKAFQPHYVGNYRIVSFKGNQVEVHKTEGGNSTWVHLTDVKYILPVDNVINKLPDYQSFGRKTKLRLNPDRIPDLHWNLSTTLNTTPTLTTQQSLIQTSIVSVWVCIKETDKHNYQNMLMRIQRLNTVVITLYNNQTCTWDVCWNYKLMTI